MRLDVPFLKNPKLDCGPIALAMVCKYYGLSASLERIHELVVSETSGASWTLGIAAAAAELGLRVKMLSRSLGVNPANYTLEYYRENAGEVSATEAKLSTLARRCAKFGGILEERSVALEELLAAVSCGSVPILLLDWGKIINQNKYIGHFVPMVGYNENQILIHNPGPDGAAPFMPLSFELFELARKAPGTDEDVLIVEGTQR